MQKLNLVSLTSDYAVSVNRQKSIFVAVYVDDILIFGKSMTERQKLKLLLEHKFKMSDMESAYMYLGMQTTRDKTSGRIFLDQ